LLEIQSLIDLVLQDARSGKSKTRERRFFLRHPIFNETLLADLNTPLALACIFDLPVPLCNLYHLENSERRLEGNRHLESVNR
jgi:hypothetical protein